MKKYLKRFLLILTCFVLALSTVACGGKDDGEKSASDSSAVEEKNTLNANYLLKSATLNGVNVTKNFQNYTAQFSEDGNVRVVITYLGFLETRNSTYTVDGDVITESFSGKTYTYKIVGDTLETVMQDFEGEIKIVLEKEPDNTLPKEVDFEGVLFGEDISKCKIFNYCPAIIEETDENGNKVMHIWFCTNKDDGIIMDHIGYRKGVQQANGKWIFSDLTIAMAPTSGTWDARHTCDPAVIKGEFKYQNTKYKYLMAYLGCITEDYGNNETGIAVANAPEGPWIKIDHLNPIIPWQDYGLNDNGKWNWGTGMPALVSLDQKGEVLLFYRSGNRGTGVQRWDFSNLDATDLKPKFTATVTSNGIVNSMGGKCSVGIPDFAYDANTKRFYVCSTTNEKNPADVTLTRVNSHCSVAYIENVESLEHLSQIMQSGVYTWKMLGYVGPNDTGWERNHNPGLVRDAYGYIPDSTKIGVVVATGKNSWDNENIFTYRLCGKYLQVK